MTTRYWSLASSWASRTSTRWPGLSQIPFLRYLFSSESKETQENEVLIALTPRIIRLPDITTINVRPLAVGTDETVVLPRPAPAPPAEEEEMLIELVRRDTEKNSGLQSYLRNMMAVMAFDSERRGRLISQTELNEYTRCLASAVTEAMHYFIGHGCYAPQDESRYLAVTAAHIAHMLRDTFDDVRSGYFNIPREFLEANHLLPQDVHSDAYRAWVRSRVELARAYFGTGRKYLNQVENPRCRLAGFAYTARFEWILNTIENEGYSLRPHYNERKSFASGLRMSWLAFSSIMNLGGLRNLPGPVRVRQ